MKRKKIKEFAVNVWNNERFYRTFAVSKENKRVFNGAKSRREAGAMLHLNKTIDASASDTKKRKTRRKTRRDKTRRKTRRDARRDETRRNAKRAL